MKVLGSAVVFVVIAALAGGVGYAVGDDPAPEPVAVEPRYDDEIVAWCMGNAELEGLQIAAATAQVVKEDDPNDVNLALVISAIGEVLKPQAAALAVRTDGEQLDDYAEEHCPTAVGAPRETLDTDDG